MSAAGAIFMSIDVIREDNGLMNAYFVFKSR